jgi:hypothetical protein
MEKPFLFFFFLQCTTGCTSNMQRHFIHFRLRQVIWKPHVVSYFLCWGHPVCVYLRPSSVSFFLLVCLHIKYDKFMYYYRRWCDRKPKRKYLVLLSRPFCDIFIVCQFHPDSLCKVPLHKRVLLIELWLACVCACVYGRLFVYREQRETLMLRL